MSNRSFPMLILLCILLLPLDLVHTQDSTSSLEFLERFEYESEVDFFRLSDLPSAGVLNECQKQNRTYDWKRTKACKAIVSRIATELEDELNSEHYSDLGKSIIYKELFRVSTYLGDPNLAFLDSSASLYCQRVKRLRIPDVDHQYEGFRAMYLQEVIWEMNGVMRNWYPQDWENVRQKHYLAHITPGAFCDVGSDWVEPNYHMHLAILMYQKGHYNMASQLLHYEGLDVGNRYWSNNRLKTSEYRKQLVYVESVKMLYSQEELTAMRTEALTDIYITRSRYWPFAYTYFGDHLIKIHLQMTQEEVELQSDEELAQMARTILMDSVIFKGLEQE